MSDRTRRSEVDRAAADLPILVPHGLQPAATILLRNRRGGCGAFIDLGTTRGRFGKGALRSRRQPLSLRLRASYIRAIGIVSHAGEVEEGMNLVKTGMLLAALTALFGIVGYAAGGTTGMLVALGVAAATNLYAYWNSDRLALSAHGAREVDERTAPDLVGMVRDLAGRANLPMPRVYLFDEAQPNAFATGRNPENSAVAVSTGLLGMLDRREVAGVVAHELAHIRNRDTLLMTVSATVAGAISTIAQFGFMFGGRSDGRPHPLLGIATALLAPLAAGIIQFAISRAREYGADRDGALICGDPDGLASALARIEAAARGTVNVAAEQHPATAPLFIINPLTAGGIDNLFSTHPSTQNRIAALRQLAAEMGARPTSAGAFSAPGVAAQVWGRPGRSGPWTS